MPFTAILPWLWLSAGVPGASGVQEPPPLEVPEALLPLHMIKMDPLAHTCAHARMHTHSGERAVHW